MTATLTPELLDALEKSALSDVEDGIIGERVQSELVLELVAAARRERAMAAELEAARKILTIVGDWRRHDEDPEHNPEECVCLDQLADAWDEYDAARGK